MGVVSRRIDRYSQVVGIGPAVDLWNEQTTEYIIPTHTLIGPIRAEVQYLTIAGKEWGGFIKSGVDVWSHIDRGTPAATHPHCFVQIHSTITSRALAGKNGHGISNELS